jgi:hypothetical protein
MCSSNNNSRLSMNMDKKIQTQYGASENETIQLVFSKASKFSGDQDPATNEKD